MSYLIEAFKALNALDEDVFSVSDDGIEKLSAFEDDDTVSDDITIYDVDAENESELEDSYIGKIILDCNVCHSKLYKDKADVVIDEESNDTNIDMECPYCYSVDGFKIIGEVAPMTTETEKTTEEEVSSEDDDVEDSETPEMEESESSDNNKETLTEECQTAQEEDIDKEEEPVEESVDLATKENTVAGVLAKHMPEFYAITDVNELRRAVIDIVDNSDIADKAIVAKLRRDLFSKKSVGALLSTIGTYMTGTKVAKVGRKNESVDDNLGTDLDKYQKWVDYDMEKYHKISNKTNSEIRKAGLQIVKDKYGDYQVTAGQYDESLKESVKDVTITTDASRTTMTSEDDGKVTVTTEPVENHDEEAEVLAPVSDETEMEIEENSADDMDAEIDDIDSDSFEESLSSVLKEQYDNVKSYTMSSCAFGNNDVVTVNGIIEFASGKKGNAQIKLESHTIDKKGNATFLTESSKLFTTRYLVSGNLKEKKFITESITSKEDK